VAGTEGFIHRFVPGGGPFAVLALHGTGGDEDDLLPLAAALAPGAPVLSPRGRVLEHGMARFFRRFRPGVLDEQDIAFRSEELWTWVQAALREHDLAGRPLVAVGWSNGANLAAALLLLRPTALAGAVLLSPSAPFREPPAADLGGVPVFAGLGRHDSVNRPGEAEGLVQALGARGAVVETFWHDGGHEVRPEEVRAAAAWLARTWGRP